MNNRHHRRNIVVIGASAGGITALRRLVTRIPRGTDAAFLVVVHVPPNHTSRLPELLSRAGVLPAVLASDGDEIECGRIYVAPADQHMIVRDRRIALTSGPRENHNRPAIDPLFRSAAHAFGNRVIGILLSGFLDDGSAGLRSIQTHGGVTIVQDPADADFPDMPMNAMQVVAPRYTLSAEQIGETIAALVQEEVPGRVADMPRDTADYTTVPSEFSCPDCGGVLSVYEDNGYKHYRCRVGHVFSGESLAAEQREVLEEALWTAIRALEESSQLSGRLADRAKATRSTSVEARHRARAEAMNRSTGVLRDVVNELASAVDEAEEAVAPTA